MTVALIVVGVIVYFVVGLFLSSTDWFDGEMAVVWPVLLPLFALLWFVGWVVDRVRRA